MKNKVLTLLSVGALAATSAIWFSHSESYRPRATSHAIKNLEKEEEGESQNLNGLKFMYGLRADQLTGKLNPDDVYKAISQADAVSAKYKANAGSLVWDEMGPSNVGGRTRAFLVDKDSSTVLYAGSVGGGLWKSTTGGSSWFCVTPNLAENMAVVSICQDNTGAIYIGTGEQVFTPADDGAIASVNGAPGFVGSGIWKSTNYGTTWTKLAFTNPTTKAEWRNVSTMTTNPARTRLFAGNMSGVFFSDDGGQNWTNASAFNGVCTEIKVATDGTVFAAATNRIYRSTANGDKSSFTMLTIPGGTGASRISIAISPQDPNYVYIMASSNGNEQLLGVWRSTNKGTTGSWTQIAYNSPENDMLASQGFWDNVIAVDPENKDHVYTAGLAVWDWHLGGNWRQVSSLSAEYSDKSSNPFYVHADCHNITFDTRTNPYTMYVANDGGVFRSVDKGIRFSPINKKYNVTQFYSVASNLRGEVLGGSQDNNTILIDGLRNSSDPQSSVRTLGGDGFNCEISRMYPDYFFAANIGGFSRSLNRGQSWSDYFDDRIGAAGAFNGTFNTTYKLWESVLNPALHDTMRLSLMFMGGIGAVWATPGALDFSKTPDWFKLGTIGGAILSMDFTRSANTVFVGTMTGGLYRISGIGGASFKYDSAGAWSAAANGIKIEQVTLPGSIANQRAITGICVHPTDSNKVVITCGNYNNNDYVFISNNALDSIQNVSFTSIQANLPKMPVYSAVINIDNPSHIILGTELGVWASTNGGGTWTEQNTGMTRVPCYMLRQYEFKPWEGPVLYVATHGRGIFRSKTLLTGINKMPVSQVTKIAARTYPNPAISYTNFEFNLSRAAEATLNVVDITGRIVYAKQYHHLTSGTNKIEISTDNLPAGNYFVRLETGIQEVAYSKFIVVK